MKLLSPRGQEEAADQDEPDDDDEVKEEGDEGEDEAADDVTDGVASLGDHLRGNEDSFAAAGEDDEKHDGETRAEDAQRQPKPFVCGECG